MDLFSRSVRFQRLVGRIFTVKRAVDGRPPLWCFTTCCETQLASHWRTLYAGSNYLGTTMTCSVLLTRETGRHHIPTIGLHSSAPSTIMLALTLVACRSFGVNG